MDALKNFLSSLRNIKSGRKIECYFISFIGRQIGETIYENGMFEGEPERDFFGNFRFLKTIGKLS
jgi:16S rRNA (cytosine1402-N4)-methyltransferase